jgi:hypothetical protein
MFSVLMIVVVSIGAMIVISHDVLVVVGDGGS